MTRVLLLDAIGAVASHSLAAGTGPFGLPAGVVTIQCSRPGLRRCGIVHPAVETYPLDRWTEDDLERLSNDRDFTVSFDLGASVAPGASTADAIRDQGAGPPIPDLGAKPDGTGVSLGVFDIGRVGALRSRLIDPDFLLVGGVEEADIEAQSSLLFETLTIGLGFEPTAREMIAALLSVGPRSLDTLSTADLERFTSGTPIDGEIIPPAAEASPEPLGEGGTPDAHLNTDRAATIRAAISSLVAPDDFTASGAPKIEAVERVTGLKLLTRAEIAAAQAL